MVRKPLSGLSVSLGLVVVLISTYCDGKWSREDCEPGWDHFKDKCYYAYKYPIYTYDEARTVCIALGGTLAKINDVQVDMYLKGYTEGNMNMWLGANDIEQEGIWKWEDGTLVTYSNWYIDQPDNGNTNNNNDQDCLHFKNEWNQKWNDAVCSRRSGFICEKEKHDSVCSATPVGLESGNIPDSQITASSNHDHVHMSYQGRLNYNGPGSHAWSTAVNIVGEWLQINLGYERKVTKLATQGRDSDDYHQWVKTYRVRYYDDDAAWRYVEDANQSPMIFNGNSDDNTIVYHDLVGDSFTSQYVRFYPQTWHGHISMRVEIYACQ